MPTIKLSDQFGLDVEVDPSPSSGIAKYFKNPPTLRVVERNLAAVQNMPLRDFPFRPVSVGLSFEQPVEIGTGDTQLAIGAGVSGNLTVFTADDGVLFGADPYSDPIKILDHQAYVSVGLKASLSVANSGKAAPLSFGFAAGTKISLSNYKLFPITDSDPTFAAALRQTLSDYSIPGELEDLQAMAAGTIVTVEGTGSLKFSASANLLSSLNPLATVSSPILAASLRVSEGGSLKVGASYELSGDYQIRVQKLNQNTVRLGYYRERGSEFQVSANVGVSGGAGNFDRISDLLGAISSDAQADQNELKNAGLNEQQMAAIGGAITAAIERRLELAISGELDMLRQKEAAFLYDIDLNALDPAGRKAVHDALGADLTALIENEDSLPSGIRPVRSIFTSIREGKHKLRVNLLGIYNYASVSQLTLKGAILYEPASGDLVITDTTNAQRIQASVVNFGADSDKLRKVVAESFLITAGYRCSKLVARAPQLKSSYWYFELHAKTNQQTMKDKLDVAQALGLMSEQEKQDMLRGIDDFGRSTFYAETNYDDDLTTALFLDQAGQPRTEDDYELKGRDALQLLVQQGDPDDYRRRPALDHRLWKQMKDGGPFNFRPLFPDLTPQQVDVIASDYVVIVWWAQAMRGMGEKLAQVHNFFAQNPNPNPADEAFKKLRNQLADHMASVAKTTKKQFADPWGLVAMDLASGSKSEARVRVTAPRLAFQLERAVDSSQLTVDSQTQTASP